MDNVFIKRLWRLMKYEAMYLRELADGFVAQRVIDGWIEFYNNARPHSALAGCTSVEPPRRADTQRAGGVAMNQKKRRKEC